MRQRDLGCARQRGEGSMAGKVEARLKELGVVLPAAPAPAANYVPWVVSQGMAFIAGQIPIQDGKPTFVGKLGREFTIEQGQQAARLCALNVIAHAREALGGDLDRVARWVRIAGYVN